MQRDAALQHALDGVGVLPILDGEGHVLQLPQNGLCIGRRQEQFPLLSAQQLCTGLLLRQTHGPQDRQNPLFRRAKAHPFRVEGKALAVFNRRASVNRVDHLGDGLDHIEPLFTDEQHQLQPAGLTGCVLLADGLHNQSD